MPGRRQAAGSSGRPKLSRGRVLDGAGAPYICYPTAKSGETSGKWLVARCGPDTMADFHTDLSAARHRTGRMSRTEIH